MSPRAKRIAGALAVVVVVFLAARLTFFRPFDPVRWQASDGKDLHDSDPRRWMYLDIVAFRRLSGLTREEVIDLLGPPARNHGLGPKMMVYPMGRAPMSLKRAWLAIELEDGHVAGYRWVNSAT